MSEQKRRELRAVRVEMAVQICIQHPNLYPTIRDRQYVYNDDGERLCAYVLVELMRHEPCVKHILDFYYRRER